VKYGENFWAALKGYLDECAATTAAPVIEKYTGVLAAADVFTEAVAFQVSSRSASTSATARKCTPDGQPPCPRPGRRPPAHAAETQRSQ
jgi:hypothetical protein